ncbi:DUF3466 family protein [Methylomonas rosea]|uniref:DUF3466 family protein n=1 Tax=Methylomonas rosea TaxID=2952227 RepID=A0ABT1TRB7_9GAMM|nr:DUF3466 family protein [Methylomonas sp. WSC-7]MCQ8117158.1 DUF3466 family protein [Methylomonas sp. WSC-7]
MENRDPISLNDRYFTCSSKVKGNQYMEYNSRKHLVLSVFSGGLLALTPATQAMASYTYSYFDAPDAVAGVYALGTGGTFVFGINASGQVVGYFTNPAGYNHYHGFVSTSAGYTTLDVPNTYYTDANSVNAGGQVSGTTHYDGARHGFVYDGSSYQTRDVPGADSIFRYVINDAGQAAGFIWNDTGYHGFTFDGSNYKILDAPNSQSGTTYVYGINNIGQTTGYFLDQNGYHGFIYNGSSYKTFDAPNTTYTFAYGINDLSHVVGNFYDFAANRDKGFVYNGSTFEALDVPDATNGTYAYGINNNGQVAGYFLDASGAHGFIATPAAVSVPAAVWLFGTALAGFVGFGRSKRGN